jgi:23S rRNA (cytosine1962-C5)-methyltransferase
MYLFDSAGVPVGRTSVNKKVQAISAAQSSAINRGPIATTLAPLCWRASRAPSRQMLRIATITDRGEERVKNGHPWIYRSDVTDVSAAAGDVVEVRNHRKRVIGRAFFSDQSQITLRMIARGDVAIDDAFWRARLSSAIAFRKTLDIDATAYRLVHGEADLIPSFIVDRYGDYLVVQALAQATDRLVSVFVPMLVELTGARGILARNDPRVRLLEGLEQRVDVLHGDVPAVIAAREGPVEYKVDPWKGQKTGLFLDQRENREAAAQYTRGRLLDCFSYNGGFALRLARHADRAEAIDISGDAVARITENARRNNLTNLEAREANVFDELRRLEHEGERYDTIVLDPPAFAKNKASVPKALAGYKDINLRALRILNPGGYLITCSCSYNVNEATFAETIYEASVDSHVPVTVVEKRMQGRDHPVLLGVPETYYLKCFILRRVA